jgi:hypothetical protein
MPEAESLHSGFVAKHISGDRSAAALRFIDKAAQAV